MFECLDINSTEQTYLTIISLGIAVPLAYMLIDKQRGFFILTYTFTFVLFCLWDLAHGFSTVDDQVIWGDLVKEWLGIRKKKLPGSKDVYTGNKKCMYLCNHSCMADLFIMDMILESRPNYLARYGVLIFCPIPMFLVAVFMNSIWYFKRGGRGDDLEPFFKRLDRNFNWFHTQRYHFSCFPEGHRSVKPYMLPLKEGMIRYAYERNLIVQPIIMFGAEQAMSEYTFRRDPSTECLLEYFCDDLIDPKDFKTLKEFQTYIRDKLYTLFDECHEKASEQNKRFHMLRHEDEKKAFYATKSVTERSKGMIEYNVEKRKRKRH